MNRLIRRHWNWLGYCCGPADPNDGQSLYNRGLGDEVFTDDITHLELLLEHGLGSGNGGPWRAPLGPVLHSPRQLLRDELSTAALRGGPNRARLLLAHGAEANGIGAHPVYGGHTPYRLALRHGHAEVAEVLASAGASTTLDTTDAFVAASMRADADAVRGPGT
ncbi:hypothetical protein GCM10010293_49490 [Streptomyces griseoflavus]|uniref:hypothetical protein n=1 Tax=Streptomyces griseoflavus TaxID=35619 RepID=UPI00167D23CC|nr:hypothetical protein [Streptomyces griseoflavus]GGV43085.1 hypothetical protein GCM10010293_49490 [Streptomyces griseoflavus]